MERGMSRPLKPAPTFKQHKKETHKNFMNRVERETQAVLNRSKFEDKFRVSQILIECKNFHNEVGSLKVTNSKIKVSPISSLRK